MGVIGVALMISSCNDRGNNNNGMNNGIWQNCINGSCNGIMNGGTPFFQSQSTDVSGMMNLTLQFMGNVYNQGYGYGYNNYTSPITSYVGQVAATGMLQVSQSYTTGFGCVIPAGNYQLQTVQPGQWNQAIVTGLVMQAYSGYASISVQIPTAQVSAKSQVGATWNEVAPVGRLFGRINVQMANGYNCQISTLVQ